MPAYGADGRGDSLDNQIAIRMKKYRISPMPFDARQYSAQDKALLQTLIEAGKLADEIFWRQTYHDNIALRQQIVETFSESDPLRTFFFMQAGPYDRLDGNSPFIDVPRKPATAGFYPSDMTRNEFEEWNIDHPEDTEAFLDAYTVIKRKGNRLIAVPYHEAYEELVGPMADKLRHAAGLTQNKGLKKCLLTKADALLTDDYFRADVEWIEMKGSAFDFAIGPFEAYEDELNNIKASYQASIAIVDEEETAKLDKYTTLTDELEDSLPIADEYKETPKGLTPNFVIVRDIYRGGLLRVGYQAVATDLPNNPAVRAKKGTKKTFWKNILDARMNQIITPVGERLIADDQIHHMTADAMFEFILLHEIAHGLGPRYVHGTETPLNLALRNLYLWIEENKADICGLHSLRYLSEHGLIDVNIHNQHVVSYLGNCFRTIRFGTSEAHGKAAIVSLNFFMQQGAITYDDVKKRYAVDFDAFDSAVDSLASELLMIESEGNYQRAKQLEETYAEVPEFLQASVDSLKDLPIDIVPQYQIRWQ